MTVVIPTIPPRERHLARAKASVEAQTLQPTGGIMVQLDLNGVGAPVTRDRGLRRVTTEWVAFLDDDDEFYPQHLEALLEVALEEDADYVWSWFDLMTPGGIRNDADPLTHFGKQWNRDEPHQTTVTTLVRTEVAQAVGFIHGDATDQTIHGQRVGEDYLFTLGVSDSGAKMIHLPQRTWIWHHHGENLSGKPWRFAMDPTYQQRAGISLEAYEHGVREEIA